MTASTFWEMFCECYITYIYYADIGLIKLMPEGLFLPNRGINVIAMNRVYSNGSLNGRLAYVSGSGATEYPDS